MSDLRMELIQGQLNDIEENVRSIKATWGNTIMTLDNIKSSLKAYRQKAIDEAYQKGFEVGQHEATTLEYQQGLEEGKKQAKAQAHLDVCHDIERVARANYQKGVEEGKARNENGCVGCRYDNGRIDHSPCDYCCNAYSNQWSAKPCSDEIEVGDEVTYTFIDGAEIPPFVVFVIKDNGENRRYYEGYRRTDGKWVGGGLDYKKTGRHFPQVAELFKAMKEGAE